MQEFFTIREACQALGIPRTLFDHHYRKNRFRIIERDRQHPRLVNFVELKKLAMHLRHGKQLLSDSEISHEPESEDFGEVTAEA